MDSVFEEFARRAADIGTARGSVFEPPLLFRSGHAGRLLVRERDDDEENDHKKSDRISIKAVPIDVGTHRTTLLFTEAAKQITHNCRDSNSVSAMHEAQQQPGCAAPARWRSSWQ
jgi:hypothetical protein